MDLVSLGVGHQWRRVQRDARHRVVGHMRDGALAGRGRGRGGGGGARGGGGGARGGGAARQAGAGLGARAVPARARLLGHAVPLRAQRRVAREHLHRRQQANMTRAGQTAVTAPGYDSGGTSSMQYY